MVKLVVLTRISGIDFRSLSTNSALLFVVHTSLQGHQHFRACERFCEKYDQEVSILEKQMIAPIVQQQSLFEGLWSNLQELDLVWVSAFASSTPAKVTLLSTFILGPDLSS